ncbi:putative ribonuclease H-like domain-containing protein [Tanacetum coccineum]
MSASQDEIPPPPPPPPSSSQTPTQQTPHTVSTIKLPILKKGEYDIWAMKMEHYLAHTDYPIWEVIQNGNGPVSITTDTSGQIKVLPPRTAEEIVARERERKARTTLLMALPEDHLAKFHKMTDAKEMWDAIKSRFGGNDESKKMQKYILKQQFEGFSVSNTEGLHKGYDRFQSLLSQLEIHGAGVSTEDANQKFLRSLPSAWSQVSLIMRTKPGVDSLSFDDLYNNLRVFESDIKGSTASSSSPQNVAFVSENTSSTNDVSTAYCVPNPSGQNSKYEQTSSYSLLANQSSCPQLDHEDLEQIDEYDLEEMDLKWQVAMISMRMKKFYKKTGRKLQFDAKEPVGFDKTKVECYNCHKTGHFARECRIKGNQDNRSKNYLNHLIRDCDFHEKRMARKAELNNGWNNVQRVNKQNQFVPSAVLTRTGKIPVSTARASSTKNFNTARQALKNKGIVDSGCSRHMTGNKAYLAEFQDFNGGPVAFGGSKGYITGKGKIKTGKLDFEDVCFVKELQHFNLFSVSQMCDKKNKVLFTDSECLVLSPEFKLPDENQVLLKIPRQNNMYSFNLENIVPSGGLACLIAKATTDESNKWHRRLGHVNFKNLNKLVKGNLVRGLPSKIFQYDPLCVACQKGKQHKASCKAKSVSSISHSLQLLHMDLFGPTSVRSLNHKTYCLVITDDFSRCDNGTEFKNKDVIEFCGSKGIKREYRKGPTWLFDLDYLTDSMNYHPVRSENQANLHAGQQEANHHARTEDIIDAGDFKIEDESAQYCFVLPIWPFYSSTIPPGLKTDEKREVSTASPNEGLSLSDPTNPEQDDSEIPPLEDIYQNSSDGIFTTSSYDDEGAVADFTNLESVVNVSSIPHQDYLVYRSLILGDPTSAVQTRSKVNKSSGAHAFVSYVQKQRRNNHKDFQHCLFACFLSQNKPKKISEALEDESWVDAMQEELLQFKIQKVWVLVDLPYGKKAIGTKWVYRNKKDERGVVVRNKARLVAQGHRQEEGDKTMMRFCSVARFSEILSYPSESLKGRGTIDKTLFIKKDKHDIILVQVYVDDIIFGSTKKSWCDEFEALMKSKFQMSSMGELTFFLGLQVKQKEDGIFISQDKYVAEILKKSMIGSLMYLTASRPDIMFAVCACSRFQVTPKSSHLSDVKRIFRYLKGKPKLGLWYPRVSSFDLESYSDSDYAGANLDRKSTTGDICCAASLLSTICIVKNPVYHSKTKHIAIRHHFIRDAYEKKLIQVLKIHTNDNVADLLTKAFDVSRPSNTSEVPIEPQTDSSPAHTSEVPIEPQTDPSPRPSPSTIIPDSIPETSGGNLGGHSSSDKSLSGIGDMTLQSVYNFVSLYVHRVSDQAKEIQTLEGQIKKLKKQLNL